MILRCFMLLLLFDSKVFFPITWVQCKRVVACLSFSLYEFVYHHLHHNIQFSAPHIYSNSFHHFREFFNEISEKRCLQTFDDRRLTKSYTYADIIIACSENLPTTIEHCTTCKINLCCNILKHQKTAFK